jgi:hypothetical protein
MVGGRTYGRLAAGVALSAATAILVVPTQRAAAAKATAGAMRITDIDVAGMAGVPQDQIITMRFTQPVLPSSVGPASVQIRAQNATGSGYTIQCPGSFQVTGSTVRFVPRLPTHMRDPSDPNGGFYPVGTPRDNASANAAFQSSKNYLLTVAGAPGFSPVRSTRNRPLDRKYSAQFTTAADAPKSSAFSTLPYADSPPPAFAFSNPADRPASPDDQYARHGGTQDVPSAIAVSVFGTKVPLSPSTVRQSGNVTCTLVSRRDDPSYRKPLQGTPFVEQNFDSVRIAFVPRFPLPDVSTYALSINSGVSDLTETYGFSANPTRLRLRTIYEFLAAARAANPGAPWEQLTNPPLELISGYWPTDPTARGILKRNLLTLGDSFADEINPRVMVIFTTRDELVTHASLSIEFLASEGLFDASRSTAEWDQSVAGAASAVFTAAGGSAVLGDLKPASNVTISADQYSGAVLNYRAISIPSNVTVTLAGGKMPTTQTTAPTLPNQASRTSPVTLKALTAQIDGQISADGTPGIDGSQTGNYSQNAGLVNLAGGAGGPGGGNGGYGRGMYAPAIQSGTGDVGNDVNLVSAIASIGGRGGIGGSNHANTIYSFSGGGGGGGSRTAGTNGGAGGYPTSSWDGPGGAGGAGATGNSDLATLVGGAGGGGGGTATQGSNAWGVTSGTGGGGGGALMIQTSGALTISTTGLVHARGGKGGRGSTTTQEQGGGGGGGGGGAVLLRSSKGFNLANASAAVDVSGGIGGAAGGPYSSTYYAGAGGSGGAGFVRFEDPNGGIAVPNGTQGVYAPVGAGVPSYVYSKWIDLGVDSAKLVNFKASDFQLTAGNDAVLVEIQGAIENPALLGTPLTTSIDALENSTNVAQASQWLPVRLVDNTPTGDAFKVPGNYSTDAVFPIETETAGRNYRFVRVRITFQLDPTQTSSSPVPFVDRVTIHYDFNF